jgi:hypothetical protein
MLRKSPADHAGYSEHIQDLSAIGGASCAPPLSDFDDFPALRDIQRTAAACSLHARRAS